MPEVFTQTAPAETKPEATTVQAPEVNKTEESLITRASKVTMDKPTEAAKPAEDTIKLDQATIDKIADPVLKASVQEAYKSMQADYTRKTQSVAEKNKQLEVLKAQIEQEKYDIPTLLNDPKWTQKAQEYQRINGGQQTQSTVNGDLTQEEFSYLTPEQQKLYTKTKEVEQTNQAILSKLNSSETARAFEQQDMTLKQKYGNYNPQTVDEIYNGMMSGKVQATREHLWKVADYDSAVERAYKLGLEDRKISMGEKVNASSPTHGVSVTPSGDVPLRQTNESGPDYFKRIAAHNFSKLMKK